MIDLNKIVNKLGKKGGKILFKKDIFEMIDPEMKPQYKTLVDKYIYQIRAQEHIIVLKNGVYVVPESGDSELNEIDLLEKYYLQLLKKYIISEVGSEYYISGIKSLQFHLKDFSIPEKIYVINRSVSKKIQVGNYEIVFKTLSGKNSGKKINLYQRFSHFTSKVMVQGIEFKISSLELALLESALVSDSELGLQFDILNRTLKKYGKVLKRESFYEIGKCKYGMGFNRLKEIAKPIDRELYEVFLDVIKKNGNLFIGEGLRGF